MALQFLGKKSLATAIPVLVQLFAAFDLAGLQGQIAALVSITASFTLPSVDGILAITGAIGLAMPNFKPPTFDLRADLLVKLELLKLKLKLLLEIKDLLLAAGVHVYRYEGAAKNLGTAATSEFANTSQGGMLGTSSIYTILLVVEASATGTVTAVKRTFGDT
jgi:hypothetical protein